MALQPLTYDADGLKMVGQLARPARAAPRAWVLVFPEALGLGEHAMTRAARLADEGYAALACDLYGGGRAFETPTDMADAFGQIRADADRAHARARGAYDALMQVAAADKVPFAAIGHCFGGTLSLELARRGADLAAVVGFHCGLAPLSGKPATNVSAPVLVCIGADDPSISPAQRIAFEEEMRGAGARSRLALFGGVVHSFTNPAAERLGRPEFARYDPEADRLSWNQMLELPASKTGDA
jgi:dienelactone hydrolase